MSVQARPPSRRWMWTKTPSDYNLCRVPSTSPTRRARPQPSGTSNAHPVSAPTSEEMHTGPHGGAQLYWCSPPHPYPFLPCLHTTTAKHIQGYRLQALTQGMEMANSYLSSLNITTPEYLNTSPTLLPTLDGASIISHLRKDTSSQLTSFVISMAHPRAYAMLATIETPI